MTNNMCWKKHSPGHSCCEWCDDDHPETFLDDFSSGSISTPPYTIATVAFTSSFDVDVQSEQLRFSKFNTNNAKRHTIVSRNVSSSKKPTTTTLYCECTSEKLSYSYGPGGSLVEFYHEMESYSSAKIARVKRVTGFPLAEVEQYLITPVIGSTVWLDPLVVAPSDGDVLRIEHLYSGTTRTIKYFINGTQRHSESNTSSIYLSVTLCDVEVSLATYCETGSSGTYNWDSQFDDFSAGITHT